MGSVKLLQLSSKPLAQSIVYSRGDNHGAGKVGIHNSHVDKAKLGCEPHIIYESQEGRSSIYMSANNTYKGPESMWLAVDSPTHCVY